MRELRKASGVINGPAALIDNYDAGGNQTSQTATNNVLPSLKVR